MKIKKGFILRTLGNEQIVTGEGLEQINFSKLIALNLSAAYLWQAIVDKEFDIQTLATLLMKRYVIAESTAISDAQELIMSWSKAGLLEE